MKRFIIGFLLGAAAVYCYLNYSEDFFRDLNRWLERTAATYRGNKPD